ncbi:Uncharacterized protein APZ42_008077, partial [Daphnia magna]
VKTLISRDRGKFTIKSPLNRSQRRSGSHEHYPDGCIGESGLSNISLWSPRDGLEGSRSSLLYPRGTIPAL